MSDVMNLKKYIYTGRFVMYSGFTNIYYRKPVRHVFTKRVQIEKELKNSSKSIFFIVVHISAVRRCEGM